MGLRRSFAAELLESSRKVDWLETAPKNWIFPRRRARAAARCVRRALASGFERRLRACQYGGPDPARKGGAQGHSRALAAGRRALLERPPLLLDGARDAAAQSLAAAVQRQRRSSTPRGGSVRRRSASRRRWCSRTRRSTRRCRARPMDEASHLCATLQTRVRDAARCEQRLRERAPQKQ